MGKVKAGIFDKYSEQFTAICKHIDGLIGGESSESVDYIVVFNRPGEGMVVAGNVSREDQVFLLMRAAENRAGGVPVGTYNSDGVACDDDGEPLKLEDPKTAS